MTFLVVRDLHKGFDSGPVLQGLSLALPAGTIAALLGPSGCGKTTLLRLLAGLDRPDRGHVFLEGRDMAAVPVHERPMGLVFQDYALFPHQDVGENVAFGLRMAGWPAARAASRVAEVLALVGLSGFARRRVQDLSGGEQQRVALARSLAPAPRLLLLDEPLGSLDRALRERLMLELRDILKRAGTLLAGPKQPGITTLYVTHDQAEAFAVADTIMVMNAGRIEQTATPAALYHRPRTAFVARFLGLDNVLTARPVPDRPYRAETALGQLRLAEPLGPARQILLRPDGARLTLPAGADERVAGPERGAGAEAPLSVPLAADDVNRLTGRVEGISFRGRYQVMTLAVRPDPGPPWPGQEAERGGGQELRLRFEMESALALPSPGQRVALHLDPGTIIPLESS